MLCICSIQNYNREGKKYNYKSSAKKTLHLISELVMLATFSRVLTRMLSVLTLLPPPPLPEIELHYTLTEAHRNKCAITLLRILHISYENEKKF